MFEDYQKIKISLMANIELHLSLGLGLHLGQGLRLGSRFITRSGSGASVWARNHCTQTHSDTRSLLAVSI